MHLCMSKYPRPEKKDVFLTYKIWLSGLVGDGQIDDTTYDLLQLIQEKGSLKAASGILGISYRKAWGDLQNAEKILGYSLIDRQRGGKNGGFSVVTPAATRLLEAYRALQQKFDDSVEEAFEEFRQKLKKNQ